MPTCPICSKEMKYINNSHLKSHNLTPTEFKAMYPEVEAIPQEIREAIKINGLKVKDNFLKIKKNQYEARISQYESNSKLCLNCNCSIPYEKRKNKFCSSNCSASFNNKGRKVEYSEKAKKSLKELGLKNVNTLLKYVKHGKTQHQKNCIICNNIFFVNWRNKSNKTCGKKCKSKAHALNNHKKDETFGKFGYYKGIYCASSWELAFLIYNLDLGKDIKRCDLNFSYIMGEETKTYFPDFLMEEKIYEVKGRELEDVALKTQSVIDAGYQIELIRKKEITPILKFLKEKYSFKCITELYDKKI